ncbi:MAG: DUF4402 domain-containing protein [Candidatus Eiseniibacteriota bacterium]|jgi:hypothetical protein
MRKLTGAVLVVAWALWAPSALAQGTASANINALAEVFAAVNVTAEQDLDFGNVIPGTDKSVDITAATAGRWLVQGSDDAEVTLSFPSLPSSLVDVGSNTLPIVYGATDAGFNTTNAPGTATTFDPASGATANIGNTPAELYVWIGGTVQPGSGQPAGNYAGTITLQATYTGN